MFIFIVILIISCVKSKVESNKSKIVEASSVGVIAANQLLQSSETLSFTKDLLDISLTKIRRNQNKIIKKASKFFGAEKEIIDLILSKRKTKAIEKINSPKSDLFAGALSDGDYLIHYAIRSGEVEIVEAVINRFSQLEIKDKVGRTPIFLSIELGQDEISNFLMEKSELITYDEEGLTPLHLAVLEDNFNIFKKIIDKVPLSANITSEDSLKISPIAYVCLLGKEAMIRIALENESIAKQIKEYKDYRGRNLLHYAAASGNHALCTVLVKKGSVDFEQDYMGANPLHYIFFQYLLKDHNEIKEEILRNSDKFDKTSILTPQLSIVATLTFLVSEFSNSKADMKLEASRSDFTSQDSVVENNDEQEDVLKEVAKDLPRSLILLTKDVGGFTPFHYSILSNDETLINKILQYIKPIVEFTKYHDILLKRLYSIKRSDKHIFSEASPLDMACYHEKLQSVKAISKFTKLIDVILEKSNNSFIFYSIKGNSLDSIIEFQKNYNKIDDNLRKQLFEERLLNNLQPLEYAQKLMNNEIIKYIELVNSEPNEEEKNSANI